MITFSLAFLILLGESKLIDQLIRRPKPVETD